MEQLLATLHEKKANGHLDVAIAQCRKSIASFVRGYVAYCMLHRLDAEQVILRINKEILDGEHDEAELKKDIAFYIKSLNSIPAIRERIEKVQEKVQNSKN